MRDLAVFLINLDSSPDRLAQATAALTAAGLTATRILAFDGRGVPVESLPLYDAQAARRAMGRPLVGGEVGCFLSHRRAAQAFIDSGARYGLVLEDDVTLPPDAGAVIEALLAQHQDQGAPWQIANLGRPASKIVTPLGVLPGGHYRLIQAHYYPMTTLAILWTRPAAKTFLARTADLIDMPVDNWIQNWVCRAGGGVALAPPLFTPAETASTIDARAQRNYDGSGPAYYFAKQRRLWANKLHALRHAVRFRRRAGTR